MNDKKQPQDDSRRKGEITREAILDAAIEVFAEKTYTAARLTDIADHMGMTIGAIRGQFKQKTDIIRALFKERFLIGVGRSIDVYSHGSDVFKTLNQLIDHAFDPGKPEVIREGEKRMRVAQPILIDRPEELSDIFEEFDEEWDLLLDKHAQLIEVGQARGQVRPDVDPQTHARAFITMSVGYSFFNSQYWSSHDPNGTQASAFMRMFFVEALRPTA